MKIQCSCGAKYAFDITPERAQQPVTFVCPACGLDASEYVTNLVRQQFGLAGAPAAEIATPPGQVAAAPVASAPESLPTPAPPVQVRIRRNEPKPNATETALQDLRFCRKHPGVRTTEKCCVCQKPICPKCMEILGYVCSPLCKEKAELQGIEVPEFAGQKSVVEKRKWRKVSWVAGSLSAALALFLGAWIWYVWFASRPQVAFAVRFDQRVYSGASFMCGQDQIVFLRGGTLARHDVKLKKEIWSTSLIDKQAIDREVEQEIKDLQAAQAKRDQEHPDADPIRIPPAEKLAKAGERAAAMLMELHVAGSNVWVATPGKLALYDWGTGKPAKELAMRASFRGLVSRGDELLMFDQQPGREVVTHINLFSGTTREEIIAQTANAGDVTATNPPPPARQSQIASAATGSRPAKKGQPVGLPEGGKPLDPARVEEQVSHLSLPQQIALPAVLAVNRGQERALAEMNGTDGNRPAADFDAADQFVLIPARDGYVQFSSRLLEQRLLERKAVKAPPKKSALDGPVSVTASAEVANEIFGEMQRDAGGDTVLEDQSRYQVKVRRADGQAAEWTAEVIGRPALFPLQTVNVVTANQRIIALGKNNLKLWESPLTYNVVAGARDGEAATTGQGPCVERDNLLIVFDQGVLSAFDLQTGNARWRVPSVGISGLFFDPQGMMYVNSTTAGPDSIKYSRQIDVTARTSGLILKIDPRAGKTLWAREVRGGISYLSGKFIYALESYQAYEDEDGEGPRLQIGLATESFVRIRRLNPANGKDLWTHFQSRAPLAVKFDHNTIQLVFKKEVQVLKFLSL